MPFANPFSSSSSRPGIGTIIVSILPPATPVLQTLSYQYPLKLIAPDPVAINGHLVHTVFILSYGGGLVAGDTINLNVQLAPETRLTLLTQGSTKIFNTAERTKLSAQVTTAHIAPGGSLCYIPDPVQPFASSAFVQTQVYTLESLQTSSLCACDWVSEGRPARNESWNFYTYTSKNEVWYDIPDEAGMKRRKLMLRDNLMLDDDRKLGIGLHERTDKHGVLGTLILRGPVFDQVGNHFMDEFKHLPRIGGRNWEDTAYEVPSDPVEAARHVRHRQEKKDQLLWTAARVRGFVLVKFGAREVEGAKRWLLAMFRADGSVEKEFGERALLCLRN